jgi:hypothetical protein
MRHLSEARLMDVLDGVAGPADRGHVDTCEGCRAKVESARAGLRLAAGADVPEPSPLYWEAFRRQVDRRLDAREPVVRFWRWVSVAAVSAAVLVLVVLGPRPAERLSTPSALPAWSALPPAEEDVALPILEALASETDVAIECSLATCVEELSEQEKQAAAQLLRSEISGREL